MYGCSDLVSCMMVATAKVGLAVKATTQSMLTEVAY